MPHMLFNNKSNFLFWKLHQTHDCKAFMHKNTHKFVNIGHISHKATSEKKVPLKHLTTDEVT